MKFLIFNLTLLMVLSLCQSCTSSVPSVVATNFRNRFKGVYDISWKPYAAHEWCVSFYQTKFNYKTAYYTDKGRFEALEYTLEDSVVVAHLERLVKKKYPNSIITAIYERDEMAQRRFVIEIINEHQLFGVYCQLNQILKIIAPDDIRFTSRIVVEND